MTKHKILGTINLVAAVPHLLVSVYVPFFVLPSMLRMYADLNATSAPNLSGVYFFLLVSSVVAVANTVLGIQGVAGSKNNVSCYKAGVAAAIAAAFLLLFLVPMLVQAVIMPVYDLTSQF